MQNYTIISLDTEKAFDKIQHPFMIKVLGRPGMQGIYLNPIEAIYNEFTANTNLNRVKLKTFSLKSEQDKVVHSLHIYSIQYKKS